NQEPFRLVPACRFLGAHYEESVCAWMKERMRPGGVILDVGAQVGLYAMLAARWVGETGQVFAFDPSPEAVGILKRHLAMNHLSKNVTVVEGAAGAEDGLVTMNMAGAAPENSLASSQYAERSYRAIEVPVMRLDHFCASRGIKPSMIKIDTEGWELHVLRGAGALLKDETITWVVEMHPYAWAEAGYERTDVEALLAENGLEAVALTGQSDSLAIYGDTYLRRTGHRET
ncbi:MAG TPA: FkbM family methyltransferase, partial [Prosthecobacter sp.]